MTCCIGFETKSFEVVDLGPGRNLKLPKHAPQQTGLSGGFRSAWALSCSPKCMPQLLASPPRSGFRLRPCRSRLHELVKDFAEPVVQEWGFNTSLRSSRAS